MLNLKRSGEEAGIGSEGIQRKRLKGANGKGDEGLSYVRRYTEKEDRIKESAQAEEKKGIRGRRIVGRRKRCMKGKNRVNGEENLWEVSVQVMETVEGDMYWINKADGLGGCPITVTKGG